MRGARSENEKGDWPGRSNRRGCPGSNCLEGKGGIIRCRDIITPRLPVATVNVGASASITATANTGAATLPLAISLCQTNPMSGQCISSIGSTVTTTIGANATPTFAIFATASGSLPFVPQTNRIFVEFSDANQIVRGSTSVAVETQ